MTIDTDELRRQVDLHRSVTAPISREDLRELLDELDRLRAVAVGAYRHWSEEYWAAGFIVPDDHSLDGFVSWLGDEQVDGGWPVGADYEAEMLTRLLPKVQIALDAQQVTA